MANKINLSESLKKLVELVAWFDKQEDVDVEKGLEKVKEGAILLKSCRERLRIIENEFEEIQKELNDNTLES